METSFIPLFAIIAVLIIAFLLASLPQVNHKTRYRVLYAIAIMNIWLVAYKTQVTIICLS